MSIRSKSILLLAASVSALLFGCGQKPSPSNATGGADQPASAPASTSSPAPATGIAGGSAATSDAPLRPAGSTETNPQAQTMAFLYYSAAGQAPPLQDWADQDARSLTSDEFARKKKSDELLAQYKSKFTDAGNIGHLVIPVNADLSEYDDKGGEFYIDLFNPSRFLEYSYDGLTVHTEFTNGEKAQHWRLKPDDAAAMFKTNNSSHGVTLTVNADVVGGRMDGGIAILRLRVSGYDIATSSGRPLAHISLDK